MPGRYGLTDGVTVEELARAIDADSYATGGHALARQGFITQQSREIECFTFRGLDRLVIPPEVRARYPRPVQRAVDAFLDFRGSVGAPVRNE